MNMVRSFLLMLAFSLAIDLPQVRAEIGAKTLAASAVVGTLFAFKKAYNKAQQKFDKKNAPKKVELSDDDLQREADALHAVARFVEKGTYKKEREDFSWTLFCQDDLVEANEHKKASKSHSKIPTCFCALPFEASSQERLFPTVAGREVYMLTEMLAPWEVPVLCQVTVNPDASYALFKGPQKNLLVVHINALRNVAERFGVRPKPLAVVTGQDLVAGKLQNPFVEELIEIAAAEPSKKRGDAARIVARTDESEEPLYKRAIPIPVYLNPQTGCPEVLVQLIDTLAENRSKAQAALKRVFAVGDLHQLRLISCADGSKKSTERSSGETTCDADFFQDQDKKFNLIKNFSHVTKCFDPMSAVMGFVGSAAVLYGLDQLHSFDLIEAGFKQHTVPFLEKKYKKTKKWLKLAQDAMVRAGSNSWCTLLNGASSATFATSVFATRAWEALPKPRFGSTLRSLPVAMAFAGYRAFKKAYDKADALAQEEHKEISLFRDLPLIWEQYDRRTFRNWFIPSFVVLHILDGYRLKEGKARTAINLAECPSHANEPAAYKAFVSAYAQSEDVELAVQAATDVRSCSAEERADGSAFDVAIKSFKKEKPVKKRKQYIEAHAQQIINAADAWFINSFYAAISANTVFPAGKLNKSQKQTRNLEQYGQLAYDANQATFVHFVDDYLTQNQVALAAADKNALIAAVTKVAHYAAYYDNEDPGHAAERAMEQLLDGRSARTAVGFALGAAKGSILPRLLGM